MLELRAFLFACLTLVGCIRPTLADESLLLLGQSPQEATFLGATSAGELQFRVAGEVRKVLVPELVRWSTPRSNLERSELLLVDGSRLVLAETWTAQPPWQIKGDQISATTLSLGKISLPLRQVRALVLDAPAGLQQRTQFLDRLLRESEKSDWIQLTNGDQLAGKFVGLAAKSEQRRQIQFSLALASEPLRVPEDRIAAILFGHADKTPPHKKNLVVGLREGSLLTTHSLITEEGQLRVRLACDVEFSGSDARDVVYLRSLAVPCVYLSDLVATDYQHEPYLEIYGSFRRDRNVLAGTLQAAGRTFAKGLGMITTARLTYRLDSPAFAGRFQRFVADVVVDDAAGRRGSVIFRVYLQRNGEWQQAFASPVVRGGDTPIPVTVELTDAKQLALVTDFADRGDERDYANWLDARLE